MTYHKKMISFKNTKIKWKFFDYCSAQNNNPIDKWYEEELSFEAQILLDSILKDCSKIENPRNWNEIKFLKGKPKKYGIWEIRFCCDKKQYRLLGVFGPNRREAAFLIGCYHKQRNYMPTSALESACKRAADLESKKGTLIERKIEIDR